MEKRTLGLKYRIAFMILVLGAVGGLSFAVGVVWSKNAFAEAVKKQRTIYPKKTNMDFEGAEIEGELRSPGDFYFQHRPEEKMSSLVKRRKNFHREILRDVVLSK